MTTALIWSCLFFTFLLNFCLVSGMCRPGDDPVNDWHRSQVVTAAFNDPDSKGGSVWFLQEEWQKDKAVNKCKEAYNHFVALTLPEEKKACLNASNPGCEPLASCDYVTRGCTFTCEVKYRIWRPRSDGVAGYERVFQTEKKEIHLPVIVKQMFENLKAAYSQT